MKTKTAELDEKYMQYIETGKGDPGDIISRLFNHAHGLEHATEELRKRIEELEAQVPKWISVEDRLPESRGYYVVQSIDKVVYEMYFAGGVFGVFYKGVFCDYPWHVTHWMHLPQPIK